MKRFLKVLGSIALGFSAQSVAAASPPAPPSHAPRFETTFLRLLQPEWLISQRTSAEELAKTAKAVTRAIESWSLTQAHGRDANACVVYVAIRPQKRIKTWTVCTGDSAPGDPTKLDARIATEAAATDIADVSGLVLFSIHGRSAGDAFPEAWASAAAGESVELGELVDKVWPDREP